MRIKRAMVFVMAGCIAVTMLLISNACKAQAGAYVISGKISPAYNGKRLWLAGREIPRDSTVITNGRFEFTGNVAYPSVASVRLANSVDSIGLFLSAGNISITATDSLKHAVLEGGKLTRDFVKLNKQLVPVHEAMEACVRQYRSVPAADHTKEETEAMVQKIKGTTGVITAIVHRFINENPDSYVSLYYLKQISYVVNYESVMPYFEKLSPAVQQTPLGQQFKDTVLLVKNKLTGTPAKEFVSRTPEGQELSLADVRKKGKYTLVDFWASWCGPCRAENPNVVKAYQAFHDKGFNIISVSLDKDGDAWKQAIAKDGMPWYHVSGLMAWKEPIAALYGVRAIPVNFLIDDHGTIVAANLRGEALQDKLGQLIQ